MLLAIAILMRTGNSTPFMIVALLELLFWIPLRKDIVGVLHRADGAARQLTALATVLERLEIERFDTERIRGSAARSHRRRHARLGGDPSVALARRVPRLAAQPVLRAVCRARLVEQSPGACDRAVARNASATAWRRWLQRVGRVRSAGVAVGVSLRASGRSVSRKSSITGTLRPRFTASASVIR